MPTMTHTAEEHEKYRRERALRKKLIARHRHINHRNFAQLVATANCSVHSSPKGRTGGHGKAVIVRRKPK